MNHFDVPNPMMKCLASTGLCEKLAKNSPKRLFADLSWTQDGAFWTYRYILPIPNKLVVKISGNTNMTTGHLSYCPIRAVAVSIESLNFYRTPLYRLGVVGAPCTGTAPQRIVRAEGGVREPVRCSALCCAPFSQRPRDSRQRHASSITIYVYFDYIYMYMTDSWC